MYPVETLTVDALALQLKQTTAQRLIADLIIQPRVNRAYFMRIQSADVIDADMILKLLSGLASLLEEV